MPQLLRQVPDLLFPTTFLETVVYNSMKPVFVLNNFPINNLCMKANWQDFYEKKKKRVSRRKRGMPGKFVCYIRGIGKAESSPGGGLDQYLGIGDPLRV